MTTNIKISSEPLSIDTAYQSVIDASNGGNCLFVGTVRDINKDKKVTHLDFETYGPMAISELKKIAVECQTKFDITKISIFHREGKVSITEIAVIIAVSSKHRKACFLACEYAIDQLKMNVPIWKKEHLEGGSFWVGARP
ncbi:MAG: molybdenum cofactor biosynthesis protein MoaE [Saprospiraceae bacterium]